MLILQCKYMASSGAPCPVDWSMWCFVDSPTSATSDELSSTLKTPLY